MDDYPTNWNKIRKEVYNRDDYKCVNCGRGGRTSGVELHAHHVVPKSKGGTHEKTNLITVCDECHNAIHGNSKAPTAHKGDESGLEDMFQNWKEIHSDYYGFVCLIISYKPLILDSIEEIEDWIKSAKSNESEFNYFDSESFRARNLEIVDAMNYIENKYRHEKFDDKLFKKYILDFLNEYNDFNNELKLFLENIEFARNKQDTGEFNIECPHCGSSFGYFDEYCPNCGEEEQSHICSNCDRTLAPEDSYCTNCGNELADSPDNEIDEPDPEKLKEQVDNLEYHAKKSLIELNKFLVAVKSIDQVFGDYEVKIFDGCPECGYNNSVCSGPDKTVCLCCLTTWKKKGFIRNFYVQKNGRREGEKKKLHEWREIASEDDNTRDFEEAIKNRETDTFGIMI
jgi:hypothetical protein